LGLFDAFKASPLRKLQDEAESNPSPESLAALAQKHIEMGNFAEALQVADGGLRTYKTSVKLKDIVGFVRKKQSQDNVKHLRDEIRVKPSTLAYSQLAGIYRDLGDIDQALELLTECTVKFTEDQSAFRMLGQIRLENFLQEVIAYDGQHALVALRKVQALNADDTGARVLLAQLYFAVGANAAAVEALKAEIAHNPTALDLQPFIEDVGAPPPLGPDVTIESLIDRCEEAGSLVNSLKGFPRIKPGLANRTAAAPKINTVAATAKVQELSGTPGLGNLAILDREGRSMASIAPGRGLDAEAFRELAWSVQSVAYESCRRMDIGSFSRGCVLLPSGGIALVRRRGTTFALGFDETMKPDRAAAILEDLVMKIVGGGGA
jgi:tetratricopeptide (TPR) repeat protein